jgi:hypothetical protein
MPRQPLEFESQTTGDDPLPMMVAKSVPNSSIVGPMFLPKLAHDQLTRFVSHSMRMAMEPSEALVFLGPPKSGKTAILHELLPRMVAAHPSDFTPVFVRVTFEFGDTPERATRRIWEALRDVANAFDFHGHDHVDIPANTTFERSRFEVSILIQHLTRSFECSKRQLWLLLDEFQVLCTLLDLSTTTSGFCIPTVVAMRTGLFRTFVQVTFCRPPCCAPRPMTMR